MDKIYGRYSIAFHSHVNYINEHLHHHLLCVREVELVMCHLLLLTVG